MKKIRCGLVVLSMLLCSVTFAGAELSIGIGLPNVSIGINLPLFPELAPVPGYPVYYAPQVNGNYFFYDGMYWVYQDDNWYASSWYNGPWSFVEPTAVPLFVLRIPVRYYRQPPPYFRGWHSNAPPRWGQHWGRGWEQDRRGWDRWNRGSVPTRAPRPVYQREYSGDRYPQADQQHNLRSQQYRYQPRDRAVRQHFKQQGGQGRPEPAQRGGHNAPQMREQRQEQERSPQHQQGAPAVREHRPQPGGQQHEQQAPRMDEQEQRHQDRGGAQEPDRGRGQGHNRDEDRGHGNKDEDRGRGRDK